MASLVRSTYQSPIDPIPAPGTPKPPYQAAPAAPAKPVGPVAPIAPDGPVTPLVPLVPLLPAGPVTPVGPWGPDCSWRPLPHEPESRGPKRIPEVLLSQKSPELPNVPEGAPGPEYHFVPSTPAGPVGPGLPVAGAQAEPFQTKACPPVGAAVETARPWSWVALPEDGDEVE
jgi:hypothetical protein